MVLNATKDNPESLRAKYNLDIEHLDYKFIGQCTKVKTLENILKVLRSGQEGVYPDLVRFTEERLRTLKPNSVMLRTEQPATTLRSLDNKDRDELLSDLKEWKDEVSAADAELKSSGSELESVGSQLPPVRGTVQLTTATATPAGDQKPAQQQQKPGRIASYDYAAWDRYDVEAQLKMLDEGEAPAASPPQPPPERSDPAIDDQPAVEGLSEAERSALALREKQKGNEYFRSGDFSRAAVYYTRSIHASPTVAAFNNRAQANLKLGKHGSALLDCSAVLRREPRNVKALLRRGIARQMARDWIKARTDFQQVLELEPHNPQAKQHLQEVEKSIIGSETKRSKVLIQEVDSMDVENTPQLASSGPAGDGSGRSDAERADSEDVKSQESNVPMKSQDTRSEGRILIQEIDKSDDAEEVVINARFKSQMSQEAQKSSSTCEGPRVSGEEREAASSPTCSQPASPEKLTEDGEATTIHISCLSSSYIPSQAPEQDTVSTSAAERPESVLEPEPKPEPVPVLEPELKQESEPVPEPEPEEIINASEHYAPCAPATSVRTRRWNTYEFLREWRSARRSAGGLMATAALLRSVDPDQLTEVLGAELDSPLLSAVIRCVDEVMLAEDGPKRCLLLLERLADARRFHVVKMLLDNKDRQRLRSIADRLRRCGADVTSLTQSFLS